MAVDNDIHSRIMQLEDSDRRLSNEVNVLNGRLDTALLRLTNNVDNLTSAIKVLQESQAQTSQLQHTLILLQERTGAIPGIQAQVNQLVVERATTEIVLKGIRFVGASIVTVLIGLAIAAVWGIRHVT